MLVGRPFLATIKLLALATLSSCVPADYVPLDVQIARNRACVNSLAESIKEVEQIGADLAVARELENRLLEAGASTEERERAMAKRMELEIKSKQADARGDQIVAQCREWREQR